MNPEEIKGKNFDELFGLGEQQDLKDGERIHIHWPTNNEFNYFWIGIKTDDGKWWVLNQKFEEYGRYWFDISEGLRIDYVIEPSGNIKKSYWK